MSAWTATAIQLADTLMDTFVAFDPADDAGALELVREQARHLIAAGRGMEADPVEPDAVAHLGWARALAGAMTALRAVLEASGDQRAAMTAYGERLGQLIATGLRLDGRMPVMGSGDGRVH